MMINEADLQAIFESKEHRTGYVTPATFAKFYTEVVGLTISKRRIYEELHSGRIRSIKLGTRDFKIPLSELVDYENRLLQESAGTPTAPARDLLGTPVK